VTRASSVSCTALAPRQSSSRRARSDTSGGGMIAIRSPQINRSSFRTVEIRSSICYAPASVTERRYVRYLIPFSLLVMATILEASGDAIIRVGLRPQPISARIALMLVGAVILYGYGLMLNLAPLAWGRLVGAYVATFLSSDRSSTLWPLERRQICRLLSAVCS
jgi:hypothetical protein